MKFDPFMKFDPGLRRTPCGINVKTKVLINIKHAKIFMIDHDQTCLVKD